jgi:MFS superfamily sulfate permease-like transporter
MNGIAISIVLGQLGKVFGFPIESGRILPRLIEFVSKLPETHLPTLAIGITTFVVMRGLRRLYPKLPAPLVAVVVAVVLVEALALDKAGVAVLGEVPAGLPSLGWTPIPSGHVMPLITGAAGLALVSFTSGMVTARSFAARNHYEIDVDREFIALGACNVAAGLSQGFAVTGADSRTAVSDAMGGKSQVTGLVAAVTIAVVLLFFTGPLRYLPISALGAVLVSAGIGLFDWRALVRFARIREGEFLVCVAATLGVVAIGALQGIAISIALAMLVLLVRSSRPADAVLGRVEGLQGFYDVAHFEGAKAIPGLVLYRFTASLIFYNAPHFRRRALAVADAHPDVKWLIVDARRSFTSTAREPIRW